VVLEVAPSGQSQKLTVFEEKNDTHERQFLTTHVTMNLMVGRRVEEKRVAAG
jgi:hypothetical protein